MAYATKDDVIAIYEQGLLDRLVMDRMTKQSNYARLDVALTNAATEIDSYVSTRYPVPITPVPAILKQINIDLAIDYLALSADRMTTEIAARAAQWRSWLVLCAKGQVGLGLLVDTTSGDPVIPEGTGVATAIFARAIRGT